MVDGVEQSARRLFRPQGRQRIGSQQQIQLQRIARPALDERRAPTLSSCSYRSARLSLAGAGRSTICPSKFLRALDPECGAWNFWPSHATWT